MLVHAHFLLLLLPVTCRNRAAAAFCGIFSLFSVNRFLKMADQRQRKAPTTARTAGRSVRSGGFTTPGVSPAHFSALPTVGQNRPERQGTLWLPSFVPARPHSGSPAATLRATLLRCGVAGNSAFSFSGLSPDASFFGAGSGKYVLPER